MDQFVTADVAEAVTQLSRQGRQPTRICPEFASRALDRWAYEQGVTVGFSRPGKPTDNAFVEFFNGKFGAECLNTHWFLSLNDACDKIEAWQQDYNQIRPHSSLGWLIPAEFPESICWADASSDNQFGISIHDQS